MSYQQEVAGNVRAEVSRRNISIASLAEHTGLGKSAVYERWNGDKEWKLSELYRLAVFLGVKVSVLTHSENDYVAQAA